MEAWILAILEHQAYGAWYFSESQLGTEAVVDPDREEAGGRSFGHYSLKTPFWLDKFLWFSVKSIIFLKVRATGLSVTIH